MGPFSARTLAPGKVGWGVMGGGEPPVSWRTGEGCGDGTSPSASDEVAAAGALLTDGGASVARTPRCAAEGRSGLREGVVGGVGEGVGLRLSMGAARAAPSDRGQLGEVFAGLETVEVLRSRRCGSVMTLAVLARVGESSGDACVRRETRTTF